MKIKLSPSDIVGIAGAFHYSSGGSLFKKKKKKQAAGTFNPVFFAWVNFACMRTLHT